MKTDTRKWGRAMAYKYPDRRSRSDRRTGAPDRRMMLDFARFGTDSEKRVSVFDRRQEDVRRASDMVRPDVLEKI